MWCGVVHFLRHEAVNRIAPRGVPQLEIDPVRVTNVEPLPVTVNSVVVPRLSVPWLTARVNCSAVPLRSVTLIELPPLNARLPFWLTLAAEGAATVGKNGKTEIETLAVPVKFSVVSVSERISVSEP